MLQTNLGDALERREKAVSPVACSWVQGRPIADTQLNLDERGAVRVGLFSSDTTALNHLTILPKV